ncbi:hypothetical protein CXB51_018537 [Gossypium anomalum]|uniref:Ubiquitin-like domain-containing protein n=3 Tax=Gossypium TaxID=3633 RepID=A0A8J6CUB8_9ROSI|nr:hypothetical protein CXB51_018537 [Gossypium anomalum]
MSGLEVEEISTSTASLERLPGKSTSSSPAVAADGSTHETFSYSKLPEETLNLSIRKLDGSSFVIEVLKSATVADLKLGVQNVFCHMPDEDADLIEKYGIKDDDQLHFTRHISTKVQKVKQTVPQDHSYTPLSSSVEGELNNEEGYKDSETQKGKCERLRSTCSKLPSLKTAGTFKNRGCRKAMASMIMASSKPVISIAASSSFFSKPKLKQIPQLSLPKLPTPKFLKTQQIPSLSSTTLKSISLFTVTTLSFAPPSLAAEIEKAALFDFNLTLPIMMVQFLFLMFALDKVYFTPLGKFMDERDAAIKEKLASVKDTSEEVKQLEEQAAAIMRAARAEIAAALNKMKKETQLEVEEKLAEGRKKVEAELQEALANLENQKEETIKSLDSQIAALSQDIVKKVLPL